MTSKANKHKRVIREVLHNLVLPERDQTIVRILSSCGSNLHQVLSCTVEKFLVSMPNKFRRNVWILRGDYVIVTPIKEGSKVKAEISVILLFKEQIKYVQDNNKWPAEFKPKTSASFQSGQVDGDMLPPSYSDSEEEEEELVGVGNPNRQPQPTHYDDSADSDSEDEESD